MVVGKSKIKKNSTFVPGKGYVSNSKLNSSTSSSSSKSSGSSSSSSSSSDPRFAVSRVPISGGDREYKVNNQWVSQTEYNKKLSDFNKKRSRRSSSRSGSLSNKGQITTTSFTDTNTGQTTTKTFQGTGVGNRLISTKTSSRARQQELDRKRLLQQQEQNRVKQLQQLQKIEIKSPESQQQLQRQTTTQTQLLERDKPVEKSVFEGRKISFAFLTESQKSKLGLTGDKYKNVGYDPFTGQYRKVDSKGFFGEVVETASQKDQKKIFLNPSQFFAKPGESIGHDLIGGIRRGEVTPSSIGKGLLEAAKDPDAVLRSMVESAATNPFGFAGEIYAGDKATKAALTPIKATGKGISKIVFSKDPIPALKAEIQLLEKAKVKKGTPEYDRLQLLKTQLDVYTDLKFKTADGLTEVRTKVKSKITEGKKTDSAFKKAKLLEDIGKEAKKADKIIQQFKTRTRSKINKAKALRKKYSKGVTQLKPETISKKLGEFFKVEKGELKLKVTKKLPTTENELNALFKQARKQGGDAFSKLKAKLKQEQGLNVVQRINKKGDIFYKFLEPKQQRKVGKLTGKKTKPKEIILEPKQKSKLVEAETKATKSLKDIEFEKGQNLEKVLNDFKRLAKAQENKGGLFSSKKAQARFDIQTKRFYNNARKSIRETITKTKNKVNNIRKKYLAEKKRFNELKAKKNKTRADFEKIKTSRQRISKLADDIKQSKSNLKKVLKALRKANAILRASTSIQGQPQKNALSLLPAIAQAQAQDQAQAEVLDQITKFDKVIKESSSGDGTKTPRTTTSLTKTRTPQKPRKERIRPSKTRKTKKEEPRKLPLPRIRFDSPKLKDRVATFEAYYRERKDPRKPTSSRNPVVVKRLRKTTTRNRMSKLVADLADRKAIRSIQVKVLGITNKKVKDIQNPSVLKKFRKTKKVNLALTEKSKYALDSRTERKELKSLKTKKKLSGNTSKRKPTIKRPKSSQASKKKTTTRRNTKPNKKPVRRVKKTRPVKKTTKRKR